MSSSFNGFLHKSEPKLALQLNIRQRIELLRHMPARVHAYNKLFMTSVQRQLKTPTLYQKSNKEEAARLKKISEANAFVAE